MFVLSAAENLNCVRSPRVCSWWDRDRVSFFASFEIGPVRVVSRAYDVATGLIGNLLWPTVWIAAENLARIAGIGVNDAWTTEGEVLPKHLSYFWPIRDADPRRREYVGAQSPVCGADTQLSRVSVPAKRQLRNACVLSCRAKCLALAMR